MNGIIVVNKQKGETSFRTVSAVRRIALEKKAGHCGTLDPLATGVLPVMTGSAVKCSEYLTDHDKIYRAKILFGYASDTEDVTGKLEKSDNYFIPSLDELNGVLTRFKGVITQVPPMYSAIKIDGKKLYELARNGIEIERKAREVTVYDVSASQSGDGFYLDVCCSKGTYIRTLCSDIGKALGCGAVMEELRRDAVGKYEDGVFRPFFSLEDAHTIEELSRFSEDELAGAVIPVERIYSDLDKIILPEFYERLFRNGAEIYSSKLGTDDFISGKLYRIYGESGFFAVGIGKEYPDGMAVKVKNFF